MVSGKEKESSSSDLVEEEKCDNNGKKESSDNESVAVNGRKSSSSTSSSSLDDEEILPSSSGGELDNIQKKSGVKVVDDSLKHSSDIGSTSASGNAERSLPRAKTLPGESSSADKVESNLKEAKMERSNTERRRQSGIRGEQAAQIFDDNMSVRKKVWFIGE
ncbi:hypothetical protein FRX31_013140 [Thalictrum thalictroides]|uniref:Uncharacterized protein n=1 Tax=Thalictrum thalictroides TaxID=46969 RepID=A0A7J6WIT0_THATH|nr:hypothetical protein FRX31_013140 [Thalictrum thalictroides]